MQQNLSILTGGAACSSPRHRLVQPRAARLTFARGGSVGSSSAGFSRSPSLHLAGAASQRPSLRGAALAAHKKGGDNNDGDAASQPGRREAAELLAAVVGRHARPGDNSGEDDTTDAGPRDEQQRQPADTLLEGAAAPGGGGFGNLMHRLHDTMGLPEGSERELRTPFPGPHHFDLPAQQARRDWELHPRSIVIQRHPESRAPAPAAAEAEAGVPPRPWLLGAPATPGAPTKAGARSRHPHPSSPTTIALRPRPRRIRQGVPRPGPRRGRGGREGPPRRRRRLAPGARGAATAPLLSLSSWPRSAAAPPTSAAAAPAPLILNSKNSSAAIILLHPRLQRFLSEMDLYSRLRHKNIAQFYGALIHEIIIVITCADSHAPLLMSLRARAVRVRPSSRN